MKRFTWFAAAIDSCVVILAVGSGLLLTWPATQIPDEIDDALGRASELELYSLDPDPSHREATGGFHGWSVLGSTRVAYSPDVRELVSSLRRSVDENVGIVAACFNPRHGIRVREGAREHDLVICFECMSVQAYSDGADQPGFLTTHAPQPVFDRVLTAAGVSLPPPKK